MSTPGGVGGLRREPHPTRLVVRNTPDTPKVVDLQELYYAGYATPAPSGRHRVIKCRQGAFCPYFTLTYFSDW